MSIPFSVRAVAIGAASASLVLMLRVGGRNPSLVLVLLFAGWVLSPFAALLAASAFSGGWPVSARKAIHVLLLVLSAGSPLLYAWVALGAAPFRPAFLFLVVPLVSWLLIAIVAAAAFRSATGRA